MERGKLREPTAHVASQFMTPKFQAPMLGFPLPAWYPWPVMKAILNPDSLARAIAQGRGAQPADVVIKHVGIFHLSTGELSTGDIAICGDRIVGVGEPYEGVLEIDGAGLTAVPGFIDAHVHVESSMVTPAEFDRMVLPRGTTTAVCDPHEMSNVCGAAALDYFLEASRALCMDLFVDISSCVPASPFETSGETLSPDTIRRYADHPRVLGLAELMNVPGVLDGDPGVLAKILAFEGRVDGHAPSLSGYALNGYLAAGVRNCHESSTVAEAAEKLRKGMQILLRDGSVAHDLETLHPLLTVANSPFLGFCTDDRTPPDVEQDGHIDGRIARAIAAGADPLAAYRAAALSSARHFRLFDRGLVAPGFLADIVLVSDLRTCAVHTVLKAGRVVGDALFAARPAPPDPSFCRGTLRLRPATADTFAIRSDRPDTAAIGLVPRHVATQRLDLPLPPDADGLKHADPSRDLAKVAVLERHGRNGNIGLGFVHGFGLARGAIASSVGHDAHNVCVVGVDDASMAAAVNALVEADGGFAVAADGRVSGLLPLPLAGLFSDRPHEEVSAALRSIHAAARDLGTPLEAPFHQLAFLPLSVIPAMRITDKGLFDAEKLAFVAP